MNCSRSPWLCASLTDLALFFSQICVRRLSILLLLRQFWLVWLIIPLCIIFRCIRLWIFLVQLVEFNCILLFLSHSWIGVWSWSDLRRSMRPLRYIRWHDCLLYSLILLRLASHSFQIQSMTNVLMFAPRIALCIPCSRLMWCLWSSWIHLFTLCYVIAMVLLRTSCSHRGLMILSLVVGSFIICTVRRSLIF